MDLYGIGFSNIRISNDDSNYIYKYDYRINVFPEEVFIHEFLHTLERTSQEYGFDVPNLHSYSNYGYEEGGINGLKNWYQAYLSSEILDKSTHEYIGINEKVFILKPTHKNNFKFTIEIDFSKEPSNIIEEIKSLFNVIADVI